MDTGGTLMVEPGAVLSATTLGGWGGITFREASNGQVMSSTIGYSDVGIFVNKASPTIQGNTIQDLRGGDGNAGSIDGAQSLGIAVRGPAQSQ